jgi:NitT/TauT family transport system ATP-binding protein
VGIVVLTVRGVRKVFGEEEAAYLALDAIDLDVSDGEFFCLLGPSGCGKSTLLNILAGFEPASAGTVVMDGHAIGDASRDRVMFFQDAGAALFPWLTVEENVQFGLKLKRIPKSNWESIIVRYLGMVDLLEHRRKFPSQLSGGMRQRLQIARALAVEPQVLLMDEPFAALDALTRRRMHSVLLEIWRETGKTIVFVTHDIAEAISLADRIGVMSVGPGSVIKSIIKIDLVRPRELASATAGRIYAAIEALLSPELERAEHRENENRS